MNNSHDPAMIRWFRLTLRVSRLVREDTNPVSTSTVPVLPVSAEGNHDLIAKRPIVAGFIVTEVLANDSVFAWQRTAT
jgi:hypothetical protein